MDNKEKYKEFAKKEKLPIFMQPYWLGSVCEDDMEWDVILYEKGGEVWGSFVYVIKKKHGFTLITMPKLTQFLGPYIKYPKGQKYYKKLSWEKEIMNYFIDNLPKFDYFNMNFHYSITNWLPFYWRGFKQTTRYTYVIDDLSDLERVFNNFDNSYRNKIRKAQKIVEIKRGLSIESFYNINRLTFERQGIKIPYSLNFLKLHDKILTSYNSREIFYAIDKEGKIHSSLYLTWDDFSSYVHMVGEDPNLRKSSAGILLVWEAIKYTKDILNLNIFDFEGSIIKNVEQVRRSFGAIQKPYFNIFKVNSKILKIKHCLRDIFK